MYPPRGEYQIVVREIEPEGIGALELAFRQRYAKLALEGLFDPGGNGPCRAFRAGSWSSPARPARPYAISCK